VKSERKSPPGAQADAQPAPEKNWASPDAGSPSTDAALVAVFVTQLRRVFSAPNYRPPLLPTVALEVHELSLRSDVGVDQLVEVLEKDAVLAAQVLRVAGSVAYGGWGQDDISLKVAVVRLGLRSLASVVWEVAAGMRVFRSVSHAATMEQIRTHSTLCAHLCRLIASRIGLNTETAFLCGLLHDIGMAATLLTLSDRFKNEPSMTPVVLDEILRETHQEVSGMIAQLWKLPPEIQNVLAHHHSFPAGEAPSRLSAVVAMVEELSLDLGHGVQIGPGRCDRVSPENLARAREVLGFTDQQETELRETAKILAASVAKDFTLGEQKPLPSPATPTASSAAVATQPAAARPAAFHQARLSLWQRLRRSFRRKQHLAPKTPGSG
jgi:putative nucleotidyltransferase with HDIG domain